MSTRSRWRQVQSLLTPEVGAVIVLAMLAFIGSQTVLELRERRTTLGESFPRYAFIGILIFGVWLAIWGAAHRLRRGADRRKVATSRRGKVGRFLAGIVLVIGILALALTFGRFQPPPVDDMPPQVAVPLLVFLLGVVGAVGISVAVLFVRNRPAARETRQRRLPVHAHVADVLDVRPSGGDEFDTYFAATCSCGWTGVPTQDLGLAKADARTHRPGREPEVIRPLG